MDETDIVTRAAAGEREALEQLIATYRAVAVLWAQGVMRDAYLAEDAVQESFLRMVSKLSGLRDPVRFRPWLRRLVLRTAINMLRNAENRTKPFGDLPDGTEPYLVSRPDEPLQEMLDRDSRREASEHVVGNLRDNEKRVMDAIAAGELLWAGRRGHPPPLILSLAAL